MNVCNRRQQKVPLDDLTNTILNFSFPLHHSSLWFHAFFHIPFENFFKTFSHNLLEKIYFVIFLRVMIECKIYERKLTNLRKKYFFKLNKIVGRVRHFNLINFLNLASSRPKMFNSNLIFNCSINFFIQLILCWSQLILFLTQNFIIKLDGFTQ